MIPLVYLWFGSKAILFGLGPGEVPPIRRVILNFSLHFLSRDKKTKQKKTPVSRLILRVAKPDDDAAHRAVMRRCQACSGAHNLMIAARLALPGALPDSTMLAASPGLLARARGNSPAFQRAQTVRALLSVRIADARRGTKGNRSVSS
jgi:hypothetical protein